MKTRTKTVQIEERVLKVRHRVYRHAIQAAKFVNTYVQSDGAVICSPEYLVKLGGVPEHKAGSRAFMAKFLVSTRKRLHKHHNISTMTLNNRAKDLSATEAVQLLEPSCRRFVLAGLREGPCEWLFAINGNNKARDGNLIIAGERFRVGTVVSEDGKRGKLPATTARLQLAVDNATFNTPERLDAVRGLLRQIRRGGQQASKSLQLSLGFAEKEESTVLQLPAPNDEEDKAA